MHLSILILSLVCCLETAFALRDVVVLTDPLVKSGQKVKLECEATKVKKKITECAWYSPDKVKYDWDEDDDE